jgi:uncharacterized protein
MLLSKPMIESYYLETPEQLLFAVKGLEHPDDRVVAVLRYAPDPEKGDRKKNGVSYRRLYHFPEQEQFLHIKCPQYLSWDPVFQATLQSVPRSLIRRVYSPRHRLKELMNAPAKEAVVDDAVAFCRLLEKEAGVPTSALGITGSLLIGLHTEKSDLDIVAFGTENCRDVCRALHELLEASSNTELSRLDTKGIDELYSQRIADTRMKFSDFVELEKRKVNQGVFRKRPYFIRFLKGASETGASYGRQTYTPLGRKSITALIADDREAIFTPCRYLLDDVRNIDGVTTSTPTEIVSFRGRFCEQARAGECIMAAGTLERVRDNRGDVRYRLLLGNSPEDIMVLWRK